MIEETVNKGNAGDYYKNSSEQQKWGLELLDKVSLSGGERVIDLGCGDGRITAEIASRAPAGSVLGIDKSEEAIRFARERFPRAIFPNLAFEVKDIRDLDFHQEFDLVFSNAALHWVPDHAPLLYSIARGLNKGGRVVAQMGGKGNADGILQILDAIVGSEEWAPYFIDFIIPYTFYDLGEYEDLLQDSGLAIERVERILKKMVHRGVEPLEEWIRMTWLPYTRRVPENLRSHFIREIADTYISTHAFNKYGTIPVEMVRLEFEAARRCSGEQ